MKKIISCILLLTLCLGLFAGCSGDNAGLESAKTYLYNMYKDTEGSVTNVNYSRVSGVMINSVQYTITWTANTDKVTVKANGSMVDITVPEYSEEEIKYTLTATIKDADGNTVTQVFNYTIPASGKPGELKDGTYVITDGTHSLTALAADAGHGYPAGNDITIKDGKISGHTAEDIFTIKNVDGGFTLQDHLGRYYYLKGTYNSPNLSDTLPEEGHVWKLVVDGDKTTIVNVSNGKTLAYSSGYSSWGVYAELTDDHASALTIVAATAPEGGNNSGNTETDNDPAADSTLTVAEAIALGASKKHNTYTKNKYYVTGKITEIYNTQYGNMKITDDEGNILTIYGTYSADGKDRFDAMANPPKVGDTVTIYGIVGQYNDSPQIKNGWITSIN